jgi:prenyltransferase beta subunit
LNIARAGQLLAAVAAANENPHAFGQNPVDLIYLIQTAYKPDLGVFGSATSDNVIDQVWAILGLAAAHASIPEDALTWLINAQNPDGSWDDGFGSLLDTTPLAVLALVGADLNMLESPALENAVDFLLANQLADGGWQTEWDTVTNANTTGIILQGLVAASTLEPERYAENIAEGRSALLAIQQDNGMIGGDFANAYSTAEAILGMSDQPFFNLGVLRRVSHALDFILAAQASDGGWGAVGQTLDVILVLSAAGWDPATIQQNGNSPIDFLAEELPGYLDAGPDAIGKSILVLVAAGQDPSNFNNIDLPSKLMETYDRDLRAFGTPDNTWHQALAFLGLFTVNQGIPAGVEETLIQLQQADGGWEYLPGFGTAVDNTALALQALLAAGLSAEDEVIISAIDFILANQSTDGGWGDSSSTAFVMMALSSLGSTFQEWRTDNQQTPLENLFTYQSGAGGFFYSSDFPEPNLISTAPAVLALLSGSYLVEPRIDSAQNFAGLVIYPDATDIQALCVPFGTPTLSGFQLLEASEVPYELQDGFLNSILGIANPSGGTMYWAYWRWNGREWQFQNMGLYDSVVFSGSIEAWTFSSWEVFPSLPPSYIPNLDQICGQRLLRNFSDQPFINHLTLEPAAMALFNETDTIDQDLIGEAIDQVEQLPDPQVEEPIGTLPESQEPEPTPMTQDTEESPRSVMPLIIIGMAGALVLITVIAILIKKQ